MQIERGVVSTCERPLLFVTPPVLAHDEDPDRGARKIGSFCFEVVVEPSTLDIDQ
jgi:hypothetical protein